MWICLYVEMNDELLNCYYLLFIYLLVFVYNEYLLVFGGMYGVWNMDDKMMYYGDIYLNYNSQVGFYSVFLFNCLEIVLFFYKMIELLIFEGRWWVKEEMGIMYLLWEGKFCRGILFFVGVLGIGVFYNYYW